MHQTMKLYQIAAAVQLPLLVYAYNPFKVASQAKAQHDAISTSMEFNPDDLLRSRVRKPEIFTKAMLELKRLEEEPTCHRVAVKLLINNCQGLENIDENDYISNNGHLQKHHVESFAASLAICDLERGRFAVPHACNPFMSSTLYQIASDGNRKLQVSPEQVGRCLEALGHDHSHWNTWLSYRDKALLFCRAARFDIDKDQAIQHHKKLIQIINEFAENLDADLSHIKNSMAEHRKSADLHFGGLKAHIGDLGVELRRAMVVMSSDITGYIAAVKSSLKNTEALDRMLKRLFQTMAQGNAEMAARQEQAVGVAASHAKSHMHHLDDLAGVTRATISELRLSVVNLLPVILSLGHRQDALDQRSEALYAAINNMTNLIQNHTEYLELASLTASNIHSTLEKATVFPGSWGQGAEWGGAISNYALRIATPLATLVLGNYGLPPSVTRNAALVLGGMSFGELLVHARHLEWTWLRDWIYMYSDLLRKNDTRSPTMTIVETVLSA